jgi:hypothetical protein
MSSRGPEEIIRETVDGLQRMRKRLYLGLLAGLLLCALFAANFVILPAMKPMNAVMVIITIIVLIKHLRLIRQNLEACRRGQRALDEHYRITTGRPIAREERA